MSFVIVHNGQFINIKKNVSERNDLFVKRAEFFIKALSKGMEQSIAETLSLAYKNKIQFNAIYSTSVENNIQSVTEDISVQTLE